MFYLFDVTNTARNYGSLEDGGGVGVGVGGDDNDDDDNSKKNNIIDAFQPSTNTTHIPQNDQALGKYDMDDDMNNLLLKIPSQHQQQERHYLLNIDEAIQRVGMGVFQYRIIVATGQLLATDSMEVVLLSFLSHVAKTHWMDRTTTTTTTTMTTDTLDANTTHNLSVDTNSDNIMDSLLDVHEGDVYGDDDNNDTLLSAVVFPAALVGAIFWGVLGDMIGRKRVFVTIATIVSIFGVGTSFVTSYRWMLLTRMMVSFGIAGLTVPFTTCAEILPPHIRAKQLTILQTFWTLGGLVVHLALQQQQDQPDHTKSTTMIGTDEAYYHQWRWIAALCAFPCVVATVLAFTVLPESPRWLLSRGESDEALAVLRKAAQANGKDPWHVFPEGTILYSHEQDDVVPISTTLSSILPSFNQVFNLCSSGWLSITSALYTIYFFKAFLDHGTVSMTVTVFSNDDRQQDYQAIFSSCAELLGLLVVFWTADRFGRTITQCVAYAVAGIICLSLALLEDNDYTNLHPNVLLCLAFLAHLIVHIGMTITWIATTEVLATSIRTTGHGTAHALARMGGALSTYLLARIYSTPTVGLILFVTSLWTTSAASKLPETCQKEMGVVHQPPTISRRRQKGQQQKQRSNNKGGTMTTLNHHHHYRGVPNFQ